jgi:Lon protease-like protein
VLWVSDLSIPLFPLRTVLFPDGPLPLRIFEPRYLGMIARCMKGNAQFGVVLTSPDVESPHGDVGSDILSVNHIGTLATITDWYQGSDGILGVTARGGSRLIVRSHHREPDGLYIGDIDLLPAETGVALPAEYAAMAKLLEVIISDLGILYNEFDVRYDDASWVGYRFAEILPISLDEKQYCLEMSEPLRRLDFLQPLLRSLRQETSQ